jgi:hypothetical protein
MNISLASDPSDAPTSVSGLPPQGALAGRAPHLLISSSDGSRFPARSRRAIQ